MEEGKFLFPSFNDFGLDLGDPTDFVEPVEEFS
jgi:hypothetical protein